MGHSRIQTTLIYTQLVDFGEDEWISPIARNAKEFRELVEKGLSIWEKWMGTRFSENKSRLA